MTATAPRAATIRSDAALTFPRIVRSEWIKLTSLRSTFWSLLLVAGIPVGSALLSMLDTASTIPADTRIHPTVTVVTSLGPLAQIAAAVLGALFMSGEFSTGMVSSTFAAVPRRLPVLAAKALVLFAAVFAAAAAGLVAAWALSLPYLATAGFDIALTEEGLALVLAGTAAGLGLVAVFALGAGAVLRSSAGAITVLLGLLFVGPIIIQIATPRAPWLADAAPYLLGNAAMSMGLPTVPGQPLVADLTLVPWLGGLVVLGWAAAALLAASLLLRSRDA